MVRQTVNAGMKRIAVARVNGVDISEFQLTVGLEQMLEPYKDTKGKVRLHQREQYAARKQVIDNLIMRELLYQEACRRAVAVTDQEFDEVFRASTAEFHGEQHFKAMLVMQGLSPDEYREHIRRDIMINKLAAAIVEGRRKPVTTEEARTYYREHRAEMQGPEARKILHIEAPLDRYASPEEEQAARRKIEPFAASVKAFTSAFKEGAAARAGVRVQDLGFIRRGQFHPLLDSVAFRSPEGEVSRIIRTDEGLNLMLVKKILPAGKPWKFEFIEEELKQKLYEMHSVAMVNAFVEELKKSASVTVYDTVADSKLEQENQ